MHLFLAKNSQWAPRLLQEIQDQFSGPAKLTKTLNTVEVDDTINLQAVQLGFAVATLPHAQQLPAESITQQGLACLELIQEKMGPTKKALNLQVFSLTQKYGVMTSGRAQLLRDKLHKLLKQNSYHPHFRKFTTQDPLIQVLIWPDRSLRVSVLESQEVQEYLPLLGPFPGGFTKIEDDLEAPSRAFKKLVESQKILGRLIRPDEKVLDLGASPGGWSYIALNNGAYVTAVDRSALDDKLMNHPNLTFVKGDAFRFESEEDFDWVISDIISEPKRVLELIEKWVTGQRDQHFIFTIKFKGDENYSVLQEIKQALKEENRPIILRQLNVNKNEVMVMGLAQEEA